jgi:hypothetical protein
MRRCAQAVNNLFIRHGVHVGWFSTFARIARQTRQPSVYNIPTIPILSEVYTQRLPQIFSAYITVVEHIFYPFSTGPITRTIILKKG